MIGFLKFDGLNKGWLLPLFLCCVLVGKGQTPRPEDYYTVELRISYESITKDFLLGKTKFPEHPDFLIINRKYTDLSASNAYIQKETYAAFIKMYEAALKDGITLKVTSASRNYFIQRIIWEEKWVASRVKDGEERMRHILKYNAIPGTSRHHWGSELDFMSPKPAFWESAYGKKVYAWLQKNAGRFGFYQPYTHDVRRTGYQEEQWHWSYAPLARMYTAAYRRSIRPEDLKGFAGDKYLSRLNLIREYVLGVAEP